MALLPPRRPHAVILFVFNILQLGEFEEDGVWNRADCLCTNVYMLGCVDMGVTGMLYS
jgi:hypothetical protein